MATAVAAETPSSADPHIQKAVALMTQARTQPLDEQLTMLRTAKAFAAESDSPEAARQVIAAIDKRMVQIQPARTVSNAQTEAQLAASDLDRAESLSQMASPPAILIQSLLQDAREHLATFQDLPQYRQIHSQLEGRIQALEGTAASDAQPPIGFNG